MRLANAGEKGEDEKVDDPLEKGKEEDKCRDFADTLRPHRRIWNFIGDEEESKLPHVLRAQADPTQSYIDGRI